MQRYCNWIRNTTTVQCILHVMASNLMALGISHVSSMRYNLATFITCTICSIAFSLIMNEIMNRRGPQIKKIDQIRAISACPRFWECTGFVLSLLTANSLVFVFFSRFAFRDKYLMRRNLLQFLKSNPRVVNFKNGGSYYRVSFGGASYILIWKAKDPQKDVVTWSFYSPCGDLLICDSDIDLETRKTSLKISILLQEIVERHTITGSPIW